MIGPSRLSANLIGLASTPGASAVGREAFCGKPGWSRQVELRPEKISVSSLRSSPEQARALRFCYRRI